MLLLPSPLRALANLGSAAPPAVWTIGDSAAIPHYRSGSPLDAMLRLVTPANDRFAAEKYAFEIQHALRLWGDALMAGNGSNEFSRLLHSQLIAASPASVAERTVRDSYGIRVDSCKCSSHANLGREQFIREFGEYLRTLGRISIADFEITSLREIATAPLRTEVEIRYTLVGKPQADGREQRIGTWRTQWIDDEGAWRATKWQTSEETISQSSHEIFSDISAQAFGTLPSYQQQMLRGSDYWRTVLDAASGVDVYGNQGIAVGDYDSDGFDDIYLCQPSGLPNRLYRNRGDGTFEDVTSASGIDVLDATSCALFADFDNRRRQDLLVVTSSGPLLFVNEGKRGFSLQRNAFRFAQVPQGTFTHAAIADYDHDGRLDVYFCLYNYYAGLDQYRYPSPYYDARNGPPNFLFRNLGDWTFEDVTESSGLNVDNNRYSFACAWGDCNGDGWPDLYVANDFGRSNLYRNNGNGTFSSLASEAGVDDVGAGMSATWVETGAGDTQDIYVANMWSAAGLRITEQPNFHESDPENIRAMYKRHARGNSFYKNLGTGKFRNVAAAANVEFGRWAWSSDFWDFDHDGFPDLYIANGYISGDEKPELASFFWRQVVGNSPQNLAPQPDYEHAWNAINELIRSGHTWSGYERNVFYANNCDGSFSDISGLSGIDFADDSRAFALTDLDHDGRLEILLKNRTAPQLRLLRNAMPQIGNSVVFRLTGTKSNRDAIGAAITVESTGHRRTKYVQAGSGFLSQHTKEVSFGVGNVTAGIRVSIRWPSGAQQNFEGIPANHRIEIVEDSPDIRVKPFLATGAPYTRPEPIRAPEQSPASVATWLLQPLPAPAFSLLDTVERTWDLHDIKGKKLVVFWSKTSEQSRDQLRLLADHQKQLAAIQVLATNVDDDGDSLTVPPGAKTTYPFPVLRATRDVIGIYNIVFRYLFDHHRDLRVPSSLLIDDAGMCVSVYQGIVEPSRVSADAKSIPQSYSDRIKLALPFPGAMHLGQFERNDFTYGVAFFQHGYLDAAADSFKQVIAAKPDDPEAYYNLGTLYLQRKDLDEARSYLQKVVKLKPNHAEAWNNLGMIAAEQGNGTEAVNDFKQSVAIRPDYSVALLNLGNVYRREKNFADAEQALTRAAQADGNSAETSYSLAMLYAQQNDLARAQVYFEGALKRRPDYADALNNFGVLLVREQRYSDAEGKFEACIRSNPDFDQAYMNLARLYVLLDQKPKAREGLQSLLRHQPEHQMAQQTLKMLQ